MLTCRREDRGFTMLEMMVTLSLAGILMATSVWGMKNYLVASRHSGTASDLRSTLRNAGERALSEGRTYCVYMQATSWTVYRYACSGTGSSGAAAVKVAGPYAVQDPSITLANISFPAPATAVPNQTTNCPIAGRCAYFYPRGTALAGSVQVTRSGSSKVYTISVEGLTSRVSTS